MFVYLHRAVVVSFFSVLVFSAVFLAAPAARAAEGWSTDMKAAMKQAASQKKDLLLDFTGSDWCGWCVRLHDEVFNEDVFKKEAPKHFVLVELDFPRDKSRISAETRKQNEEWMARLGVEGFPTIFLVDARGRPYAQTGYQPGGAEKYIAHLEELRKIRIKRDEAFARAAKASGEQKAKFLDEALEAVGEKLAISGYAAEMKEIIALDKDDRAGLKAKYEDRFNVGKVRKVIAQVQQALYGGGDLEGKMKLLDEAEKKYAGKGKARVELMTFKVKLLGRQGKGEEAMKLIDRLLEDKQLGVMERIELTMQKVGMLRRDGKLEEVVTLLTALTSLKGIEPDTRIQLSAFRAQTLGTMGKTDEALKEFDKLLARKDAGDLRFRLHVSKAEILARAGRKEDAAKEFDAAVEAAADKGLKQQIRRYRDQILQQGS